MKQSSKPLVITFLGSIGTGKTTFTRQLIDKERHLVRLNVDALRLAWYGTLDDVIRNSDEFAVMCPKIFRTLDYIMRQVLSAGTSVILDVAQYNKADRRHELYQLATECGAEVILVWMRTPRELIIDRVTSRESAADSRRISRENAEVMLDDHDRGFAPPTPDEKVIEIDGTQSFEEQYASFKHQLEQLV